MPAPSNDEIINAVAVLSSSFSASGSSVGATGASDEPDYTPASGSIWFVYRPETSGVATFNTQGSTFDTTLFVYKAGDGPDMTAFTKVAENDDEIIGGEWSQVTFQADAGSIYYFKLDGWYDGAVSRTGPYVFTQIAGPAGILPYPETRIIDTPASLSNLDSATFTFEAEPVQSGLGGAAGFEVSLDGGAFTAAASQERYSNLADGLHRLEVRSKDADGTLDPTPAVFTWRVDTTAPQTQIIASPATATSATDAQFIFGADETDVTYEVSLDGGAFVAALSSVSFTNLSSGAHALSVRATDAAGNREAAPVAFAWTIRPDPTLSLSPTTVRHAEGDTGDTPFVFTVTRAGDLSQAASVDWAVAGAGVNGADFHGGVPPSGSVSFAAGESAKTITILVAADQTIEADEAFSLTLSNPVGAVIGAGSATGIILDDDQPPEPEPTPEPEPEPPTPAPIISLEPAFQRVAGFDLHSPKTQSATITLGDGAIIDNPLHLKAQTYAKAQDDFAVGKITQAQLIDVAVSLASDTAAVAVQTYQFFTGSAPTQAGISYLVDSDNATDLTDPYYAGFNEAARYINFAVNLGVVGAGREAFAAQYAGLSFEAAAAKLYDAIIGNSQAEAAGVSVNGALAYLISQQAYFEAVGGVGIGAEAALAGYILYAGTREKVGIYYEATHDYLSQIFTGATVYGVDIIGASHASGLSDFG